MSAPPDDDSQANSPRDRVQFGIKHWFIWTAMFGVAIQLMVWAPCVAPMVMPVVVFLTMLRPYANRYDVSLLSRCRVATLATILANAIVTILCAVVAYLPGNPYRKKVWRTFDSQDLYYLLESAVEPALVAGVAGAFLGMVIATILSGVILASWGADPRRKRG